MFRKLIVSIALFMLGPVFAYGQDVPAKEKSNTDKKEIENKKEIDKNAIDKKEVKKIKNVPAAENKSKPAKIQSAARPGSIKPNQPVQTGKPPVKGKPPGTGKPNGN